jgi:hypothetical protein
MNRESLPAMGRVARGLGFVFASLALTFFVGLAVAILFSLIRFSESEFTRGVLLSSVLPWVLIVVITLQLVGLFLCAWVPPESETRGVLFWAVGLNVLGDGLVVVQLLAVLFTWWPPAEPPLNAALSVGAQLLNVISFVFFVVFLKRLSRHLGNGDGEADAEAVLFLFVASLVLWFLAEGMLLVAVLGLLGPFNFGDPFKLYDLVGVLFWVVFVPLGVLALIVGLIALIKYCNLLTSLRDVILRQMAETAADPRGKKSGLAPF